MIRKKYWHVRDKWKRHLSLVGHPGISRHIPPTRLLSEDNLKHFLNRNPVVFVKPVYGSFGNNIMKIARREQSYLVQRENQVRRVAPSSISRVVFGHTGGQRYLMQKGISILKVKDCPVDFRVLLLKPDKRWLVAGIMGKMATGNRVVTNLNHGGKAFHFNELLRFTGWSRRDINHIRGRMYRISLAAAHQFSQRYQHCRRLGIDIALDEKKQIWIIEVNTNPFFDLFKHHEDKELYGKIVRIMKKIKHMQLDH